MSLFFKPGVLVAHDHGQCLNDKGLPYGKPLEISGTTQSTIGLPAWVSMMMVANVYEYCHNEPQKYYLPSISKIFFMGPLVMHSLLIYFVRIRLIMCNLEGLDPKLNLAKCQTDREPNDL
ncbi:MAG TPA: hypothetical protein VF008_19555 [Niastella sp.]